MKISSDTVIDRAGDGPLPTENGFFREIEVEFLIHEMKDPISVIETGARTLLEKQERFGALTPRQQKTLRRVCRNAIKARDMLYSMLETGRSQSGHFACSRFLARDTCLEVLCDSLETHAAATAEKINRGSRCQQILESLEKDGIVFHVDKGFERVEIHQDETKFRQIVGNLMKNALHFRRSKMAVELYAKDDVIFIEITDDGPGIATEHQQLIFTRYRQACAAVVEGRSGHGLGLAGARIMARCLGGDIDIDSRPGVGTTFCLRLPKTLAAPSP